MVTTRYYQILLGQEVQKKVWTLRKANTQRRDLTEDPKRGGQKEKK